MEKKIKITPLRKGEDGKFKGGFATVFGDPYEQDSITNINCTPDIYPGQDVTNQNCYCISCGGTLTDTSCGKP
ncbi:MAG: hypothetical protein J5784_01825 [Muribaculaceae bacterium]|nr:hypothetical protein [Muribaculaceae bacterium]MBR5436120.1 hypothetical protein [Muribaculaceae bacterium]